MAKDKLYAIRTGEHIGVYDGYDSCKSYVHKVKGVDFMAFPHNCMAQAQKFIKMTDKEAAIYKGQKAKKKADKKRQKHSPK